MMPKLPSVRSLFHANGYSPRAGFSIYRLRETTRFPGWNRSLPCCASASLGAASVVATATDARDDNARIAEPELGRELTAG